jgi:Zn-dependent peptidase ImmA (M78 family)
MTFRRGFKSDADWYAGQMRVDLGVPPHGPLCPWKLADHLEYSVTKLSDYVKAEPHAVTYLKSPKGQKEFSAITLCFEGKRLIIHNDAHRPCRQAANISHELAHGLLMHTPASLTGEDGARMFDPTQEKEAHWLGPALLISKEAALHIAGSGEALPAVCKTYGVSEELLRMRLQVTGALIRTARRRVA